MVLRATFCIALMGKNHCGVPKKKWKIAVGWSEKPTSDTPTSFLNGKALQVHFVKILCWNTDSKHLSCFRKEKKKSQWNLKFHCGIIILLPSSNRTWYCCNILVATATELTSWKVLQSRFLGSDNKNITIIRGAVEMMGHNTLQNTSLRNLCRKPCQVMACLHFGEESTGSLTSRWNSFVFFLNKSN